MTPWTDLSPQETWYQRYPKKGHWTRGTHPSLCEQTHTCVKTLPSNNFVCGRKNDVFCGVSWLTKQILDPLVCKVWCGQLCFLNRGGRVLECVGQMPPLNILGSLYDLAFCPKCFICTGHPFFLIIRTTYDNLLYSLFFSKKKECFPVGCVPPAHWPLFPYVYWLWGWKINDLSFLGGGPVQGVDVPPPGPDYLPPRARPPPPVTMWPIPWCIWCHIPPDLNRVTHTCENITFAHYATRAVKICKDNLYKYIIDSHTWMLTGERMVGGIHVWVLLYNYRPHAKYGEGNVFTGVCHSVHKGMHTPPSPPHQWMLPSEDRRSTSGRYASYWNASY